MYRDVCKKQSNKNNIDTCFVDPLDHLEVYKSIKLEDLIEQDRDDTYNKDS